jgi:hypothetical protein
VFLLDEVAPWHSTRLSRLVKTPKLHVGDTGLACALPTVDAAGLRADRTLLGQLLETFVFQELRRQASWFEDPLSFFHFRDRDRVEVDLVIERGARSVAGVEVKAGATVTAAEFRGLRKLKEAAGKRFAGGVVLYDGEMSAGFGPTSAFQETLVSKARGWWAGRPSCTGWASPRPSGGRTQPLAYDSASRRRRASVRSGVSHPSVNQR